MLRRIPIIIAALIAAFAILVALQPSEFHVERSATVAAPAADVFAQVNDFHNWDAWSPWAKIDPEAKTSFEGPPAGTGAVFKWSGNRAIGEGSMTIADSRPNDVVKIDVDIVKPHAAKNVTEFTLKPDGDQTDVTWSMSGHQDFLTKAVCLVMNGKKLLGNEMEKGLAQMKTVVESRKKEASGAGAAR
jgi:hypothetical protein